MKVVVMCKKKWIARYSNNPYLEAIKTKYLDNFMQ